MSLHLFFNPEGMTCKLVSTQDSDLVIRFCKDVESRSQTVVHNTMISCTLSLRFVCSCQISVLLFFVVVSESSHVYKTFCNPSCSDPVYPNSYKL